MRCMCYQRVCHVTYLTPPITEDPKEGRVSHKGGGGCHNRYEMYVLSEGVSCNIPDPPITEDPKEGMVCHKGGKGS